MQKQQFICISCPIGCMLTVQEDGGTIHVSGNACGRGKTYGIKEFTAPERMVTSCVLVRGGVFPISPCKTAAPVPKERVRDVLHALQAVHVDAPITVGQTLLDDAAGTGIAIIATRDNPVPDGLEYH